MDRDEVDGWLADVDVLLDGCGEDESVSGDAMRWSPEAPEIGPVLPHAMWDACMRPSTHQAEALRAVWAQLLEAMQEAGAAAAVVAGRVRLRQWQGSTPVYTAIDETHEVAPDYWREFAAAALEARRNRDTGPPRPPMGRRVR